MYDSYSLSGSCVGPQNFRSVKWAQKYIKCFVTPCAFRTSIILDLGTTRWTQSYHVLYSLSEDKMLSHRKIFHKNTAFSFVDGCTGKLHQILVNPANVLYRLLTCECFVYKHRLIPHPQTRGILITNHHTQCTCCWASKSCLFWFVLGGFLSEEEVFLGKSLLFHYRSSFGQKWK